jgi:four helix bundle protein
MSTFKKLEDIVVWQKAKNFCVELKTEIIFLMGIKDFELKEQLKASSGSVMDNIAEGFGRRGNIEFKNFFDNCSGFIARIFITDLQNV